MAKKILRRPAVEDRTGLPRSTIYYLMARNEFPRPIKLSARSVGWDSESVEAWIEQRIKESRAA